MPSLRRVDIPNYSKHVVKHGHNRQVVFAATEDYQRYLSDLRQPKYLFEVKINAYGLLPHHVQLTIAGRVNVSSLPYPGL